MKLTVNLNFEKEIEILQTNNLKQIVGIDEVGRGCWGGPVAVGAYIFTANSPYIEGINDSKLLTKSKREYLHKELALHKHKVIFGKVETIDKIGIGKTIEKIIQRLISELNDKETLFLIDGRFKTKFGDSTKQIIKGDMQYYSIAAASILAKVRRDRLMCRLDKVYPDYGFSSHKGYGTKKHIEALSKFGYCNIHRKSYKPIQKFVNQNG